MKKSYITVTDQFCGAGGSSQGVRNCANKMGGGLEVHLAMNHWRLAIETHNTNFPDTLHDCADISNSDPRRYPSTDILITSPECTNHSLAKGQKRVSNQLSLFDKCAIDEAAERSRATMWDVPRFAEFHKYNVIIVENVVDARMWVMWDAWLMAMHALGYMHKCVYLNSMHFWPTPQSRDRMYVVFWKKGNKAPDLDYRPLAYSEAAGKNVHAYQSWKNASKPFGKYRTQYVYRCPETNTIVEPYYYAAFNCIDWSDVGKKIGERKKPLSPNTERRIRHGLEKYKNEPFQVINYSPGYSRPIDDPFYTITTNDHHAIAVPPPFIINDQQSTGIGFRVKNAENEPFQTISTQPHMKLVMPFIAKLEHSSSMNVRPITDLFATQTTRQSMCLIVPKQIILKKNSNSKGMDEALTTQTQMMNHGILIPPPIQSEAAIRTNMFDRSNPSLITPRSLHSFMISYNYAGNQTSHITEPVDTISTRDRMSLIGWENVKYEDCFYRMIKPHEVQLAMAFDKNYIVLGNSKDKVKQLGNAVTPPVMEWLVEKAVESLK